MLAWASTECWKLEAMFFLLPWTCMPGSCKELLLTVACWALLLDFSFLGFLGSCSLFWLLLSHAFQIWLQELENGCQLLLLHLDQEVCLLKMGLLAKNGDWAVTHLDLHHHICLHGSHLLGLLGTLLAVFLAGP